MNKITQFTLSAALGMGLVVALSPTDAHAATSIRDKALSTAAQQKGDPYRYGAAGPNAFDCSGLTYYSYKKNGKTLPRTAQGQYNKYQHVSESKRKKGDLVFIGTSSSRIYHVGIYAGFWSGRGWMWDAPKPGRKVGLHKIVDYVSGPPKAYYARVN